MYAHKSGSLSAIMMFAISLLVGFDLVMTNPVVAGTPSRAYRISALVPFEIFLPQTGKPGPEISTIAIEACPGEFEPTTFALTVSRTAKNVTLTPIDLKNGNHTIPKENVDVRVVKVWKQAGQGPRKTKPVDAPELLLKDDAVEFKDSYDERNYSPPKIPSGLSVRTDLEQGRSKQFWVTVKVPQDAPPGDYRGGIRLEYPERQIQETVQLQLKVLPIQLREPRQDRLIYYRGMLGPGRQGEFVGEDRFVEELNDIREHGFTGVTIYDGEEQFALQALDLVTRVGFRGPVVFIIPTPKFLEAANARKIPAIFYGFDEPNSPERMKKFQARSSQIREFKGKTVTGISKKSAQRLADARDLNDPLDVVNFTLNDPEVFRWIYEGGPEKDRKMFPKVWYYWQIMMEKPGMHRLFSGFFLWRSRTDGIFPFVYQQIAPPNSPFDDFAPWAGDFRVHMVTYPSADGPIPTLQWEALREGIDDLRYLTTLESLIAEAKAAKSPDARNAVTRASALLDELTRKVVVNEIRIQEDGVLNPIKGVGPRDYALWRKQVVERILDLQAAMQRQR